MKKNPNKKISNYISFSLILSLCFGVFYYRSVEAESQDQVDSDRDGLTDLLEREYGTDPLAIDTDGDGYTDYQEVRTGYDPLKAAPGDKINNDSNEEEIQIVEGDESPQESSRDEEESYIDQYYDSPITDETNLTDVFSETINYLEGSNLTSGEISVDELEKMLGEVIPEDQQVLNIPPIDESIIKVEEETTKENLQAYLISINQIFKKNFIGSKEDKEEIFENDNYDSLEKYIEDVFDEEVSGAVDIQLMYSRIYEEIMDEVVVPREAFDTHLEYLRSLKGYTIVFDDLANVENDPIRAMVAYNKFLQANVIVQDYVEGLEALQKKYDLVLE